MRSIQYKADHQEINVERTAEIAALIERKFPNTYHLGRIGTVQLQELSVRYRYFAELECGSRSGALEVHEHEDGDRAYLKTMRLAPAGSRFEYRDHCEEVKNPYEELDENLRKWLDRHPEWKIITQPDPRGVYIYLAPKDREDIGQDNYDTEAIAIY